MYTYKPHGVDSSHHVWINVSANRGLNWGIGVDNIHKGESLFFTSVYKNFEVKYVYSKGPWCSEKEMTIGSPPSGY